MRKGRKPLFRALKLLVDIAIPLSIAAALLVSLPAHAEDSFLDRCRAYAKEHDILPPRMDYEPFKSKELMELLGSGTVEDWKEALEDEDPKVRTLGVLAIGFSDDPSLLPLLRPLLTDKARTFDYDASVWSARISVHDELPPQPKPQPVAAVVSGMIHEWTQIDIPGMAFGLGLLIPVDYDKVAADFDEYWRQVKDPERLVTVWRLRFVKEEWRAGPVLQEYWEAARKEFEARNPGRSLGGEALTALMAKADEVRLEELKGVKARIAKELPPILQAVIALAVGGQSDYHGYYSTEELSDIANKHLTRDFAIKCLKREPPFSDPYVAPANKDFVPYGIFLENLLLAMKWPPEDADLLLQMEAEDRELNPPFRSTAWVIAASRAVRDDRARSIQILKDAMQRCDRRNIAWKSRFAREIWDVVGASESEYLVDMLYGDIDAVEGVDGAAFLPSTVGTSGDDGCHFMRLLISDERSGLIPASTMIRIARLANRLAGEEIVAEKELSKIGNLHVLSQPNGLNRISLTADTSKLRRTFPKETKLVLDTLADWHKRLTGYVEEHEW